MLKKFSLIGAVLAAALLSAPAALAGSLEVGPVTIQMIGAERTATLEIRNTDAQEINVQIRAVDWHQPDGVNQYTPARNLLVSPPFFSLAPGEAQTVRIVINGDVDTSTEQAYRLIIDELPNNTLDGEAGVVVPLRILIPVFLTPSTDTRPEISFSAQRQGDSVRVYAENAGEVRERLSSIHISAGETEVTRQDGLAGYILAQSRRSWSYDAAMAPDAEAVTIVGNGMFGSYEVEVPIED